MCSFGPFDVRRFGLNGDPYLSAAAGRGTQSDKHTRNCVLFYQQHATGFFLGPTVTAFCFHIALFRLLVFFFLSLFGFLASKFYSWCGVFFPISLSLSLFLALFYSLLFGIRSLGPDTRPSFGFMTL